MTNFTTNLRRPGPALAPAFTDEEKRRLREMLADSLSSQRREIARTESSLALFLKKLGITVSVGAIWEWVLKPIIGTIIGF